MKNRTLYYHHFMMVEKIKGLGRKWKRRKVWAVGVIFPLLPNHAGSHGLSFFLPKGRGNTGEKGQVTPPDWHWKKSRRWDGTLRLAACKACEAPILKTRLK